MEAILQHCSGFCHTSTWISHGCTCVPHPETPSHRPPHPIPQGHPSAPALSTLSHASIYFTYDNIHVSMLFSQIIPPSPSPRVQKTVLYICVSFAERWLIFSDELYNSEIVILLYLKINIMKSISQLTFKVYVKRDSIMIFKNSIYIPVSLVLRWVLGEYIV